MMTTRWSVEGEAGGSAWSNGSFSSTATPALMIFASSTGSWWTEPSFIGEISENIIRYNWNIDLLVWDVTEPAPALLLAIRVRLPKEIMQMMEIMLVGCAWLCCLSIFVDYVPKFLTDTPPPSGPTMVVIKEEPENNHHIPQGVFVEKWWPTYPSEAYTTHPGLLTTFSGLLDHDFYGDFATFYHSPESLQIFPSLPRSSSVHLDVPHFHQIFLVLSDVSWTVHYFLLKNPSLPLVILVIWDHMFPN